METNQLEQAEMKEENEQPVSRRSFLKLAWASLGLAAFAELGFASSSFLAPRVAEDTFGGVFRCGSVETFPPGSVTPFTNGRFYLVRLADGGFLALSRQCTHLGCAVPWDATAQQFVCPCHASMFNIQGDVLNPPAPRPLDHFPVVIENGEVVVDTSEALVRDRILQGQIIYPES